MAAPTGWQFAVEIHPPDWRFPAGPSWVGGWIYAGPHQFVTDLRAWVDGRAWLGLPGLPKPGLDEKFLGRPGPPYSGFVLRVEPHRGASLLRLEARDAAGCWTEFFRTTITVDASAGPFAPPAALSTQLQELTLAVLRLRSQRPPAPWSALADEIVSAALAEPLNSLPVPPFYGALEEPRATGWLRYGRLSLTGWLAHRTLKITRVTALADAVQESILRHGLPRPDVGEIFPDLPDRAHSLFGGHVNLPANQSAPALLKIFAELEDGGKHLVFAQRFVPRVIAGGDVTLPPLSGATFARALWALRGAARRYGLPAGDWRQTAAATRAAWAHYRAEAPGQPQRRPLRAAPAMARPAFPLRVLVATHNLNLEGAPWFIFELARYLAAQPGLTVRVVSSQEGPMRGIFAAAGIPVEVIDLSTAFRAPTPGEFHRRLQAAAGPAASGCDLVIANTVVSFWAVHLARAARQPSVLYVHESTPVRRSFEPILTPALMPLVEEGFRFADRVVFTADASRQVFDYLNDRGNFALLPSWVDVARIDAFAATHHRAALRAKHGLDPDAVLIVNIGSVCERKGQHIFVRAIELLKDELRFTYPGRKIHFLMVGARPGIYLESLQQELVLYGLDHALFLPETHEIFDFYLLADLLVCTSFEESFPRVLLEAAAFRLPIISTNVNGIPEMLAADEAWLIPPGDRYQLGAALKLALTARDAGDTSRADRARATIVRRYRADLALPQHLALIREVARASAR